MNRSLLRSLLALVALAAALLPAAAPRVARAQLPDEEIVYIDPDGVIRVRDTQAVGSRPLVTWNSPTGDYTTAALIDANGDGDMEIAALRNQDDSYRLDLYDPVVTSGPLVPGQSIGGIPWALLFSLELDKEPALVAAGNLDASFPGDELFVTVREPREGSGNNPFRQDLFYLQNQSGDGRSWRRIDLPITGEDWSSVALGDMDRNGIDEIGLVATRVGDLHIWRMTGSGGAERIYDNESDDMPWQHLAMGQFRGDGRDLLGGVRDAPRIRPSLVVLRISTSNGQVNDDYWENFEPSPRYIFFADVNGSGDDEAYMLRSVPVTNTVTVRLFMRQRNTDPVALVEDRLDSDNGYQAGAGGDLDGDGRDEVVLLRNTGLRIYASPETSTTFSFISAATDSRTILIGDLDRIGFVQALGLATSTTAVDCTAPTGGTAAPVSFQVTNGTNSDPIAFRYSVEGSPPWAAVSADRLSTPATLSVVCDAAQLAAGIYTSAILLTSPNPLVLNQPVRVELRFTVTEGLLVQPPALAFVQYPCQLPAAGVQSQVINLIAPQGTPYTVSLVREPGAEATLAAPASPDVTWPSSVPWASAFSATGVAPESLTITVDFSQLTATVERARAVIIATVSGSTQVRAVPITALCASSQVPLPAVGR